MRVALGVWPSAASQAETQAAAWAVAQTLKRLGSVAAVSAGPLPMKTRLAPTRREESMVDRQPLWAAMQVNLETAREIVHGDKIAASVPG
jgi:hypothetical protein